LFCGGKKIEDRATVRNDRFELPGDGDLFTELGGVGRLREYSLHLLFFRLLGIKGGR